MSLTNVSTTAEGSEVRILDFTAFKLSGVRARSAIARFPPLGEERIRDIPVPCVCQDIVRWKGY